MAIETSATQQSRRPRHNPENNNPIDNGRENLHSIIVKMDDEELYVPDDVLEEASAEN
jgi:hypothetical protein